MIDTTTYFNKIQTATAFIKNIYDGKINPSRKVDVSKISSRTSISQQWVIEAEKALAMSNIEPLSFLKFQEIKKFFY